MVTNLPPNAQAQYKRVVASKSKMERLQNLQIFISMIPEHKGTQKLRANVKRQISRLEEEIGKEKSRKRQVGHQKSLSFSRKEDELLLLLLYGSPEIKGAFLSKMSDLSPESFYTEGVRPYSRRIGGVNTIFLPIGYSLAANPDRIDLARQTDGAIFLISSEGEIESSQSLIDSFRKFNVFFLMPGSEVKIMPSATAGTNVIGNSRFLSREDVANHVLGSNLVGATIVISEFSTIYSLDAAIEKKAHLLRYWFLLDDSLYGKYDGKTILLRDSIPAGTRSLSEAVENPTSLLLDVLSGIGKIRVWTKEPGEKSVSREPVLLREGATILDLAKAIHGELAMEFSHAILYRPSEKIKQMRVGSRFQLKDGDTVEVH